MFGKLCPPFRTPLELIADTGARDCAVLRFAADLPIRRIREFGRDFIARGRGGAGVHAGGL